MANHRQNGTSIREQIVMSAPSKLLVERYLSPKGKKLLNGRTKLIHQNKAEKAEINAIWDKYGKNRYRLNPDSVPLRDEVGKIKRIIHT